MADAPRGFPDLPPTDDGTALVGRLTRTDRANAPAVLIAQRCIVAVHAHPDDESTKAAATISLHAAHGVRCVLADAWADAAIPVALGRER